MTQDIGGIYSDQRCVNCGGTFVDDLQSALRCPDHAWQIATKFKVKIKGTTSRFNHYGEATRYLNAVRGDITAHTWRKKEKTIYDVAEKFLEWKHDLVNVGQIKKSTHFLYGSRLSRMINFIGGDKKVSELEYGHIHTFLYKSSYKPKTIHDSYVLFKEMVRFAEDLGYWPNPPSLKDYRVNVEKTMKLRKTIDKDTQNKILDEVYRCEWPYQPRLYIGIKFLCTYINVRPGELLSVNEEDLNRVEGTLVIRKHKTGSTPKVVRLLREDLNLLNTLPTGVPGMPLFRHDRPVQRVKVGDRFGHQGRAQLQAVIAAKMGGVDITPVWN